MSDARILDRGYRRYEGERRGQAHAVVVLARHALRRVLGLGRPARAKVLPVVVLTLAYLPVLVIVALVVLVEGAEDDAPGYVEYYGFVFTAVALFVVFVAPEALCPDRRYRTLGLYLASPLGRGTYVVAKVAAVGTVLLAITVGPPLVLLVALTLVDAGPGGVTDVAATAGRILASGVTLSVFLGLTTLVVASFTTRKGFASMAFVALTFGSTLASGIAYDEGRGHAWAPLLDPVGLPLELVTRIFAVPARCSVVEPGCVTLTYPDLSTAAVVIAVVTWTVLAAAVLWGRYRRLEVSG